MFLTRCIEPVYNMQSQTVSHSRDHHRDKNYILPIPVDFISIYARLHPVSVPSPTITAEIKLHPRKSDFHFQSIPAYLMFNTQYNTYVSKF